MNRGKLFVCFVIGLFIISLGSTAFAGGSFSIQWGKGSESGNYENGQKHKKGSPPPHAPAHGYRAKHQYLYYPSRSVYYDTGRGLYFYLKGDNWEAGASLPSNLKDGMGDHVIIELDTDKPYVHHKEHVKQYPPKKKKKRRCLS